MQVTSAVFSYSLNSSSGSRSSDNCINNQLNLRQFRATGKRLTKYFFSIDCMANFLRVRGKSCRDRWGGSAGESYRRESKQETIRG